MALAYLLKHKYKKEAIAIGIRQHPESTKRMLYEWADLIILVDKKFLPEVPAEYQDKLKVWDVGTDVWFKGFDKVLLETYRNYIQADGLEVSPGG